MVKNYTEKFCANLYIQAAVLLGFEFDVLDEKFGLALLKKDEKQMRFINCTFDVNSSVGMWLSKNKYVATRILSRVTNITPKQKLFELKEFENNKVQINAAIVDYIKSRDYKVVIKALDLCQGKGVFILPKNEHEIEAITEKLYFEYNQGSIIVEDYFKSTKEYRILLYKGRVFDILQRIPPFVIGDGSKTIAELIHEKNEQRATIGFKQIIIDEILISNLGKLTLDSILAEGTSVQLRNVCNLAQGGETKRIDISELHPDYIQIFKDVYEITNLNFIGLDLMVADTISQKPSNEVSMINEINYAPSPDVSFFADIVEGEPYKGVKNILKEIFEL